MITARPQSSDLTLGSPAADRGAYLTDSWNRLDFVVVGVSVLDLFLTGADLPFVTMLRMLRTLRPLRMIAKFPGMRIVLAALAQSAIAIGNVLVIFSLCLLMFGSARRRPPPPPPRLLTRSHSRCPLAPSALRRALSVGVPRSAARLGPPSPPVRPA